VLLKLTKMKTIFKIVKIFSLLLLTFLLLESCSSESNSQGKDDSGGDTVGNNTPTSEPKEAAEDIAVEEPALIVEPEPIIVAPAPIIEPVITDPVTTVDEPVKPSPTNNPDKMKPSSENRTYVMPSFPFPPPKASASHTFEENVFAKANNLYEVSELIEGALKKSGYYEKSYYKIPNGFALVTRMEKIKIDGSPAEDTERWDINPASTGNSFSLMSYFKSLFVADDGNYRIIVFLITSENMRQTEEVMTMEAAKKYLTKGYNRLPNYFKTIPFSEDHSVSALIYEWHKMEHEKPIFMEPSKFLGQYHLAKNKFVEYISR
jgi:hypothetical protein